MTNQATKLLFTALFTSTLISCGSDEKPAQESTSQLTTTSVDQPAKFTSVNEMIEDGGDFAVETGTYKLISENPLHIQVSSQVNNGDQEKMTRQNAIKTFVYVTYSIFARTNIDELTVTSVPIQINEADRSKLGEYIDKYKVSHKVTRAKAREVMNKYVGVTNFDELLGAEDNGKINMSLNSIKFDQLKSETGDVVNSVYSDLIK